MLDDIFLSYLFIYLFHLRRSGIIEYYPFFNPNLMSQFQKVSGCKTKPPPLKTSTTTTKTAILTDPESPRNEGLDGEGLQFEGGTLHGRVHGHVLGALGNSDFFRIINRRVGKGERLEKDERLFVHVFFSKLGDVGWWLFFFRFLDVYASFIGLECVYLSKGASWQSPLDPKYTHRIVWNTGAGGGGGRAGI